MHASFQSEARNFRLGAGRSKGCLSKDPGLQDSILLSYASNKWDNWDRLGRVWHKQSEGEYDICLREEANKKRMMGQRCGLEAC